MKKYKVKTIDAVSMQSLYSVFGVTTRRSSENNRNGFFDELKNNKMCTWKKWTCDAEKYSTIIMMSVCVTQINGQLLHTQSILIKTHSFFFCMFARLFPFIAILFTVFKSPASCNTDFLLFVVSLHKFRMKVNEAIGFHNAINESTRDEEKNGEF